ncbi:hypothetical protein Q4595_14420 [Wenyingzhuangia sp. 1_MG-2023]|nr:hypothetical protein [Wenyingzhuangia sp. 1_MG-2023]
MYQAILFFHSTVRWFVLISLVFAIFKAYKGYIAKTTFSKTDNLIRHWTATLAHIQLMIGILLYAQSPIIKYFWSNFKEAIQEIDTVFFGLIHLILMTIAILFITLGSAFAKRKQTDQAKFKTMLLWFSIALFIIFIAIPWPFSPLANRPYFR